MKKGYVAQVCSLCHLWKMACIWPGTQSATIAPTVTTHSKTTQSKATGTTMAGKSNAKGKSFACCCFLFSCMLVDKKIQQPSPIKEENDNFEMLDGTVGMIDAQQPAPLALTNCHLPLHHWQWPLRTISGSHHYLLFTAHPSLPHLPVLVNPPCTLFLINRWRPCWPKFALTWRSFTHTIDWKLTSGRITWSIAWTSQMHLAAPCPCRLMPSSGICMCSVDSSLSAPPKSEALSGI